MNAKPIAVAASLLLVASFAFAAPPSLEVARLAVERGRSTEVTFRGKDLGGELRVWLACPANVDVEPSDSQDRRQAHITVPEEVPVGIYAFRLSTAGGVSDPRLLLVDDLPFAKRGENHQHLDRAHTLPFPSAVEGSVGSGTMNYYEFAGRAGQPVSIEIVAARVGSRLDPFLRLIESETGRELAYSDDFPGCGRDARLATTLPHDGRYRIEIRDVEYQGGGDYVYQLRLGDFPLVVSAWPPSAVRGESTTITPLTSHGPLETQSLTVASDASLGPAWFNVRGSSAGGSTFVPLEIVESPDIAEGQGDTRAKVEAAAALTGQFEAPGDRDFFTLQVDDPGIWRFAPVSDRYGSPALVALSIQDASGKQLAKSDAADDNRGRLSTKLDKGSYELRVTELVGQGGPAVLYRVVLGPDVPGFSLRVDDAKKKDTSISRLNAKPGSKIEFRVVADRTNHKGPIALAVSIAGEDQRLTTATIPADKPDAVVSCTLPDSAQPGEVLSLVVRGWRHEIDSGPSVTASVRRAEAALTDRLPFAVPGLGGDLRMGVVAP